MTGILTPSALQRFGVHVNVTRADEERVEGTIGWSSGPGSRSTRFSFPSNTPIADMVANVTEHLSDLGEPLRFRIRDEFRAALERSLT